ncbi:MAG: hypothetical protein KA586_05190 [Candidatus Promineofilum sp.]|nr:hypothetical protein [Promineifilum sp.]
MFATNEELIEHARDTLWERRHLLWLIGGSGSGKSTVSRAVAARAGIAVYDMDEAFFGRYTINPQRHPATTAWFSAEDPLGWMLAQPWPEFDALYRAANAETLDLLAADLSGQPDAPLIIDGGITHPSVLVGAVPAECVICLERDEMSRAREWETAASRAEMKAAVLALPDGATMWSRFLAYDRRMTATIGRESRERGIRVVAWDEATGVERLAASIWRPRA